MVEIEAGEMVEMMDDLLVAMTVVMKVRVKVDEWVVWMVG
jgi:hypothetical protein